MTSIATLLASLPTSRAEWLALIDNDPDLRARLFSHETGNAVEDITRDVICAKINELAVAAGLGVPVVTDDDVDAAEEAGAAAWIERALAARLAEPAFVDSLAQRVAAIIAKDAKRGRK